MSLRRAGLLFVFGGLVFAVIPLVDDIVPALQATFLLAPVALLGGIVVLDRAGIPSRVTADTLYIGFGLGALVGLANLLLFLSYDSISAGSLGVGLLLWSALHLALPVAFIGETLLAYDLRDGPTPRPLALFLPLSLPLDLPFNAIVTPLLGHGLSLSGLAWVAFGWWLWRSGGVRLPGSSDAATAATTGRA